MASNPQSPTKDLIRRLSRVGSTPATADPIVRADASGEYGRAVFAAEWGLDSNQDVARGGVFARGPFRGGQWLLAADGHGPSSAIPKMLRELPDGDLESCMSSRAPGAEIERLVAARFPNGTPTSGACLVLARITLIGEIEVWNAGDSRAVVLAADEEGGSVTCLLQTADHSASNASELRRHLSNPRYDDAARGLPSDPSLEELQQAGVEAGLLQCDPNMLAMLPPREGSTMPRATLAQGFRFAFSQQERSLQMSRSVGHQPLGVSGTNWDHYRVIAPPGSKVHVILSSDGLWDVAPGTDELFHWCELGGKALLERTAYRWCGDWDFEHPWNHPCADCRRRRVEHLSNLYARLSQGGCAEEEEDPQSVLTELTRELRAASQDTSIADDERAAADAALTKLPLPDTVAAWRPRRPVLPPAEIDSIFSVQEGVKPDDVCVALCSWQARGHVTVVKGVGSRIDSEAALEFAARHQALGEHCIGVHFDGDPYTEGGMQECIARVHSRRGDSLPITAALRRFSQDEPEASEELGGQLAYVTTWTERLGRTPEEAGFALIGLEGPRCALDETERYSRHGAAHLESVMRIASHPKNNLPVVVLCVGSGKVTQREQTRAPADVPFYVLNIDRPLRDGSGREAPAIKPPESYPSPSQVDWSEGADTSVSAPHAWLMRGGSSLCFSTDLPIGGAPSAGAPLASCLGVTAELQSARTKCT
jgi:hypothetical protein